MSSNLDTTQIGGGTHRVIRVGSIALGGPLKPARRLSSEPALFVPEKWEARVVRVGKRRLVNPRELPAATFQPPGGRVLSGRVLHVPRDTSVVIGRDPQPKEDGERDDRQICIELLRVGAEPTKVSSAVVSLVRLSEGGLESVMAVNGHYRGGDVRRPPTLFPSVNDENGQLRKRLDGPHVAEELLPGDELVFGYMLEELPAPKTYSEPGEKLYYTEGLLEAVPGLSLDWLFGLAGIGDRAISLTIPSDVVAHASLLGPDGGPAAERTPSGIRMDVDRLAVRVVRNGSYALIVGSDPAALENAVQAAGGVADALVLRADSVAPVHARLDLRDDGEFGVVAHASPTRISQGLERTAHDVQDHEFLMDAHLLLLGDVAIACTNQRATSATSAPHELGTNPGFPARVVTPEPPRVQGWLNRLMGR